MKHIDLKELFRKSRTAVIILAVMLTIGSVGGVYAYLASKTEPVRNVYKVADIDCDVDLDADTVTNNGNIPARVRTAVVVNWVDANDEIVYVAPEDYTVTVTASGWTESGGYYYYDGIASPAESIAAPVVSASLNEANDALTAKITILAEAIQATPANAASEAWGYSFD